MSTERNITYSPKGGASIPFQKVFGGGADSVGGLAIITRLHAIQKSCAGLKAVRKVAVNANVARITGLGTRAILTMRAGDGTTFKVRWEHFDPSKSVDALGAALVGKVFAPSGPAATACVATATESVEYV